MNRFSKMLILLAFLVMPFSIYAAMMAPKGQSGTWEGVISGNHCAVMGILCPVAHRNEEVPVFVPDKSGKHDFATVYYLAVLPIKEQQAMWGKEVKVSGMAFKNMDTIMVNQIQTRKNGNWKTIWTAPKLGM